MACTQEGKENASKKKRARLSPLKGRNALKRKCAILNRQKSRNWGEKEKGGS